MPKTALIHSDDWRRFDYGSAHPLRMERLGLTWRLMETYGLTTLAGSAVHRPEPAPESAIARYHRPEYIEMLKACNDGIHPRAAAMFGLGPGDNPVFQGVWDCARLVAGGSLLAADLIAKGEVDRVFHFAGGLHHAADQRASGFCYVNDAVLAIMRLRERGLRVAYKPDVVVAQLGVDAHRTDPLTHLGLDIQGFAKAVRRIADLSPQLLALGGGGYDLQNVARGWTAAWAVINGVELPAELPASYAADARAAGFTVTTLWDAPAEVPEDIQAAVRDYVTHQVSSVRETVFPHHGI